MTHTWPPPEPAGIARPAVSGFRARARPTVAVALFALAGTGALCFVSFLFLVAAVVVRECEGLAAGVGTMVVASAVLGSTILPLLYLRRAGRWALVLGLIPIGVTGALVLFVWVLMFLPSSEACLG